MIFTVNKFIGLRLEADKTFIYVNEERFDQCKSLVLNIPLTEITHLNKIDSIDEAADKLLRASKETIYSKIELPPDVEFWGHCSNLQVWAENNYNTRLLHSNLAFPLLKRLSEVGDPIAHKVLKEEIAKRFSEGYPNTIKFLADQGLLKLLDKEEFYSLLDLQEADALIELEVLLGEELEILNIDFKPYTQGFWFKGKHIVGFYLSNCNLGRLPESIGNFRHLEVLLLNENLLKALPDLIGRLDSLKILDLRNNQLQLLPDSIGSLINLEELKVSGNRLIVLPGTLVNLKSLRSFSFIDNNLSAIPDFINEMRKVGVKILY